MKWEGGAESSNVEDRRSLGPAVAGGGGIGVLVLMAVVYFLTGDPNAAKQAGQVAQRANRPAQQDQKAEPINDRTLHFSKAILGYTEQVWGEQFAKVGKRYENPHLVLFAEQVDTGCGTAPSAVGPFYCPADHKLYLDPSFFEELEGKLGGSKADFSKAYVIAHEIGHHVQNLLGYHEQAQRFERREGKNGSVRLELQADYLAGVWAHFGQERFKFIEPGDVESAIKTAQAIGDDRLQKRARGWVSPEGFTHGTSAQRIKYFQQGFQTGDFSKRALDHFFDPNVNPLDL